MCHMTTIDYDVSHDYYVLTMRVYPTSTRALERKQFRHVMVKGAAGEVRHC